MLDRRTSALLRVINETCTSEGASVYKVFAREDFLDEFYEFERPTDDELIKMISRLSDGGYISVKYACDGMYCLRPLPRGVDYRRDCIEENMRTRETDTRVIASAFIGAFSGTLAAGILFGLAYFLLRY